MERIFLRLVLALLVLCTGCAPAPRPSAGQAEATVISQHQTQAGQESISCHGTQRLGDIEARQGPFTLAGQSFNVVLHYKCLPGKNDPDSRSLASLDIHDAKGKIQYRQSFPYTVKEGAFIETCLADVRLLRGSNGTGFLIESQCLPSAPLAGGPWQIVGLVGSRLVPLGKPLATEGEWGDFVPGAVTRRGGITQILPDMIRIRIWTGYFFISYPVRVDWREGKLSPGQRCMHQTGHGFAEEGCEMPVDGIRLLAREQDLTFVRMFSESREDNGPASHIVVKTDSKIEVVAGKILITWQEGPEAVYLSVGEDVWVKVRIDGKEGWIHTPEDLNAIGLFQSG